MNTERNFVHFDLVRNTLLVKVTYISSCKKSAFFLSLIFCLSLLGLLSADRFCDVGAL